MIIVSQALIPQCPTFSSQTQVSGSSLACLNSMIFLSLDFTHWSMFFSSLCMFQACKSQADHSTRSCFQDLGSSLCKILPLRSIQWPGIVSPFQHTAPMWLLSLFLLPLHELWVLWGQGHFLIYLHLSHLSNHSHSGTKKEWLKKMTLVGISFYSIKSV